MNNARYIKSALLLLAFMISSCAWFEKTTGHHQQPHAKKKSAAKFVQGPKGKIPLEVKKPGGDNIAMTTSPQRKASLDVVSQGRTQLEHGQREHALQSFQEAITLDGTNGIAYYYLARTHYELGHYEQAMGLLERAETLLADAQDWLVSINALRETIRKHTNAKT